MNGRTAKLLRKLNISNHKGKKFWNNLNWKEKTQFRQHAEQIMKVKMVPLPQAKD